MNDGADFNVIGLHGVEDQMGLEAKTSMADRELVHLLTNQGKVREKLEGTDQAGVVGVGLIGAELAFGEVVDVDQVGPGALR